jgi:segregation and condensation protein A
VSLAPPGGPPGFHVHLDVFDGPFDLLLTLISKHELDVTEVALAQVTDEFLEHVRRLADQRAGPFAGSGLDQASQFLVVAATLLDLKAARLLPAGHVEDEEDIATLEARDLLFARLLQYRAYRQIATWLAERFAAEEAYHPHVPAVDPALRALLPEVVVGVTPHQLALIAAGALRPKPPPVVPTEHVHVAPVDMAEQTRLVTARLRSAGALTFRALVADADRTLVVVARFLVLLELYHDGQVAFDQLTPLGELTVRWMPGAVRMPEDE